MTDTSRSDQGCLMTFGGIMEAPARVASSARALAARQGVDLVQISPVDNLATALGLHCWLSACEVTNLMEVPGTGVSAIQALSRILTRASGVPAPTLSSTNHKATVRSWLYSQLAAAIATTGLDTHQVREALQAAASDLSPGLGQGPYQERFADAITTIKELLVKE